MIKIENTEVFGWEAAIRGLRNPMNSWNKSDSTWCYKNQRNKSRCSQMVCDDCVTPFYEIGENDLKLMKSLSEAGNDHAKFLRMINVTCDITAPLYWIAEHDTYKVATVRNSCSFMHKGVSKPFELSDFTIEHGCESEILKIIDTLNFLRKLYLETKDFKWFRIIRQILPQGYNVKYTWQANYQVLKSIYFVRNQHRLEEWRIFCEWIKELPYFKEICIDV